MARFVLFVRSFSQRVCWVSVLALTGMMLLTSSDVVLRYCGYPIKGTYDIVGLLGAVVIALPIAHTQILRRHVTMDFMASRGSMVTQKVFKIAICLLTMGAYLLIAWQCALLGTKFWGIGRVSDTIEIPIFPFIYVVAFGCVLNCFVLLIDLYGLFTKIREE